MLKIRYLLLFIGGSLLSSCSDELSQIPNIANPTGGSSIQKQRDEGRKNNNTELEIAFSEKLGQQNFSPTITYLYSVKNQEERNGFAFHGLEISDEVMLQVFNHLSIKDLIQASQVCRGWYQLSEDPTLWRKVRLYIHGDYPSNQATKEQAKLHMLRVHVNTLSEFTAMEHLITKYELNKQRPFVHYQTLICESPTRLSRDMIDEQATKGNEVAIERKIQGLTNGEYGYESDPEGAVAYNEYLVKQGNQIAIERKIEGLADGEYGYESNPEAAATYNEHLVKQGNEVAMVRKINGLTYARYGYEKVPKKGLALNEYLVKQGNQTAMDWKITGLAYGIYGYKEDAAATFSLNEELVIQGNPDAIERKIKGLTCGFYGYEKNVIAALELNERLIGESMETAIRIKLNGLSKGCYGYKKNLEAAVELNEYLIKQGNEDAIIRKIKALSKENNLDEGDDLPLYENKLPQLKSWIEEEANKGTRWASYLKANGLKYGILGFNKNSEAAIEYIKRYNIPY